MEPTEKPEKFTGIDFKRWQQKMFFYLTTLCLQRNYILSDLQDDLYNVYSGTKTTKELWGVLERKYKMEDAGTKSLIVNEAFQVSAIMEKLPPMWKDFKNYLKHKRKEMSDEDLIIDHKSTDFRSPKKEKKKDQANLAESKKEMDDLCAMFSKWNLMGNPREWWIDSGATRHVCANKDLFSTLLRLK
ncbi:hypothetical protein FXO38_13258 [Capsicum annuum]|nr:hypothetical protein FXO38_13258 [Capsicum annuum]KAF3661051.1 hypothetical protein FXO37_13099 [Capsicum annuum]